MVYSKKWTVHRSGYTEINGNSLAQLCETGSALHQNWELGWWSLLLDVILTCRVFWNSFLHPEESMVWKSMMGGWFLFSSQSLPEFCTIRAKMTHVSSELTQNESRLFKMYKLETVWNDLYGVGLHLQSDLLQTTSAAESCFFLTMASLKSAPSTPQRIKLVSHTSSEPPKNKFRLFKMDNLVIVCNTLCEVALHLQSDILQPSSAAESCFFFHTQNLQNLHHHTTETRNWGKSAVTPPKRKHSTFKVYPGDTPDWS